jgi:hypothetical protein
LNGALKRRLEQHLLVRGDRDFESVEAYEAWFQGVMDKANRLRTRRVNEELEVMRPIKMARLAEHVEITVMVSGWSTIRVLHNAYSVPSRLIGEQVRVRIFEDRLEVWYAQKCQLEVERLTGRGGHRINYRHIIWSLVRKPWAFARYRYREELFPTLIFRRAYDSLRNGLSERTADLEYLRILHLAASTMESEVEAALVLLLDAGSTPTKDEVRGLVDPVRPELPAMEAPSIDLTGYDTLLESRRAVAP